MTQDIEPETKLSAVLSGVAGEYFVAAELSARGYIASITLRNTKGVDIVCTNSEASRSVAIQVKTRAKTAREWILNQKVEDYYADNLFYVFVTLNDSKRAPEYFIVPSKIVADYTRLTHKEWLDAPGRSGAAHNNTTIRKFKDTEEAYLNRWDLLGL
jgi:hypothetical protein